MSTIDLRISGRLYRGVPKWQADRLKRLIAEKVIRTLAAVDAELSRMSAVDARVKVLDDKSIEIDGAVFVFKRMSAETVREGIAGGTFKYKPLGPGYFSGWYTGDETEKALKIMWVKTSRNGNADYSAYNRATSEQKAAMQIQIDEMLGRDLFPNSSKFRKDRPYMDGGFEL